MTRTIYLAGPVDHPEDGGHGWRERVKTEYGHEGVEWLDPLDKYDVPASDVEIGEDVTVAEIVESDKAMVERADAVLARYDRVPSAGTPMEILYAYERDTPVVVWIDTNEEVSPWVTYHATEMGIGLPSCVRAVMGHARRAPLGESSGAPASMSSAEDVAASVAEEAAETLHDRTSHGGAVENHRHIAALWSALLGHDVTARQVALCMILVKMSRGETGEAVRDHDVDICGYAGIARACAEEGEE